MAVNPRTANSIVENLYNQAGFKDPVGKAWWSDQIASGKMSPEQATRAFKAALPTPAPAPAPAPVASSTGRASPVVAATRAATSAAPAPVAAAPAAPADSRAGIKMSAADQVEELFRRDLNRPSDPAGKAFWVKRAQEVTPAQLNAEFREAAKAENPQAGQLTTPRARSTLPGEPGYEEKNKSFVELIAPIVVPAIAIFAPTLLPQIGSALGATGAVAQNAIGSAVVNAGVTAAGGGSGADILRAAAAGGAGGAASTLAGQAVAGALPTDTLTGRALEAGAKGAAGAGAGTLVQTGDVGRSLQAAGVGGLAGGAGELASVAGQRVLPADVSRTTQALVAGGLGGATEAAIQGQDPLLGGVTSAGLTAGATQLRDAEAAKQAARDQVISAFMQPASPGVGTQLGDPTAQLSGAFIPEDVRDPNIRGVPAIDLPDINLRPAVVGQDRLPEITVTAPTSSDISPVLSPIVPATTRPSGAPTRTTTQATGGTPTPSGAPSLTYTGPTQPEFGPPTSGRQTPATTPSGGGGGAAPSTQTTVIGGGGGGGGGGQPSRTDQILDLTGIRQPPTPRLPEVTVSGERDLDRLPEVQVTGEEDIERLPQVDVTAEEDVERPRSDIDYVRSQIFPLTPITIDKDKELINYLYGNITPGRTLTPPGEMPTGSSALAQALGVGDPGSLYLGKKGKERKPVWNIESLKLKDELGGEYG
jgi:hypothetical protein